MSILHQCRQSFGPTETINATDICLCSKRNVKLSCHVTRDQDSRHNTKSADTTPRQWRSRPRQVSRLTITATMIITVAGSHCYVCPGQLSLLSHQGRKWVADICPEVMPQLHTTHVDGIGRQRSKELRRIWIVHHCQHSEDITQPGEQVLVVSHGVYSRTQMKHWW